MKFWKKEKDCCSWDGVTWNTKTGKVVALDLSNSWLQGSLCSNSSLFKLHGLRRINLSFNNFSFSTIPSEFGQLFRLTQLNLSFSMFSGHIPSEISFLTHLVSLSLFSFLNYDASSLLHLGRVDFANLIQNMTNLRHLCLRQVDISSSVPEFLAILSSFLDNSQSCQMEVTLDYTNFSGKLPISIRNLNFFCRLALHECNFVGSPPSSIWNLSQLTYLDLSWNHFSGYVLPSTLGNLAKLTYLLLQSCQFSCELPSSLGNLTQLEVLVLTDNSFSGQIPSSLGNLTKLKTLYLSINNFSEQIPTSLGKLSELNILNLAENNLDGVIPSCLFTLPSLKKLFLAANQFSGPLTIENISSSQLEILNLYANKLEGRIPWMMFKLANLTYVSLDNNNLSGTIEFGNFCKLSNLQFLFLSSNSLSITIASTISELPKFQILLLRSCNIGEFPEFLKTQDQLKALDLSWNKIESKIPKWFWALGKNLEFLDLSGNKLHGSITIPPLFMSISNFFISQKNWTRIIPPSFRKWAGLKALDMSMNHFSGTIPRWLGSSLEILNLQGNNFIGSIPHDIFTYGSMHDTLRVLDLSHNQLQGRVPQSLINCSKLQVLNLGHNKISDTFPFWLQSLPELQVLVLCSNKFFDPIWHPIKYFGFTNLGTIDLSFNHFDGSLPSEYFRNWDYISKAPHGNKSDMRYFGQYKEMSDYSFTYAYSMSVMNKGSEMKLRKALKIFMSIDLSNKRFDGEIPSSIGKLQSLIMLNLNKRSGRIPQQLENLTFLEYLNLSHNTLEGLVPQGTQLDTFSYSSFEGNPVLCGSQLPKKCENADTPIPFLRKDEKEESENGFTWKVVAMGYGCGFVVGAVIGHVTLSRGSSWFLEKYCWKVFLRTLVNVEFLHW
ncbi:hypothetical protein FNV43_RR02086 [Rhamnella rubrinervis]|uniref:Disease resistance R13L4/SHOC-2-like LRR domain-containing protein n=1 Tax=Rhamnella rubrinervis TaxID=2594499 RepID=A0A8K0HSK9_9ROSA|nr:hypothetical protein FNV43_RR02086 [Rhamnella rubrinervis]